MESCILEGYRQRVKDEACQESSRRLHDQLVLISYQEVLRYRTASQSKMIDLALKMNCGAIMPQGWGSIIDDEPPGIQQANFESFGKSQYEKYSRPRDQPLPQAMDHQVDVAILLRLKVHQAQLLTMLKAKLFGKKSDLPWYEIFPALFVLLSNLEYIHGGALTYLTSKTKTVRVPVAFQY